MKSFLVVPICLVVAACATPGTEPDSSEPIQLTDSRVNDTLPNSDPDTMTDNMLADTDRATNSSGIEELEAPQVDETPPSMIPGRIEPEAAIVCERVVPTGSILPKKVCRSRTEIERKEKADQEIFDDIKRNTAIFNTRL